MVTCATWLFFSYNVRSLLRMPLDKSSVSYKAVFSSFCDDSHWSPKSPLPSDQLISLLWKIQHEKYNTNTTCLYNTLIQYIQHALIQHEVVVKLSSEILQDRPAAIKIFCGLTQPIKMLTSGKTLFSLGFPWGFRSSTLFKKAKTKKWNK